MKEGGRQVDLPGESIPKKPSLIRVKISPLFISPQNIFSFSRYLNFVFIFCHAEKRPDQKRKVNFKSYDVAAWETNNCNTHITKYLMK